MPGGSMIEFPALGQAQLVPLAGPAATPGACPPGQVRCRTLFSGLSNGTERHFLTAGPYGRGNYPCGIGYQHVGEVLEAGDGVDDLRAGDLVFSGMIGRHASHFLAPAGQGEADLLVKLPTGIEPTHAALLGGAGVAARNVRRAEVRVGMAVLVVGAGLIGQFTARLALLAGADVTLASRTGRRHAAARPAGIEHFATLAGEADFAALRSAAGTFDAVFDDAGLENLDPLIDQDAAGNWLLRREASVSVIAGQWRIEFDCLPAQLRQLRLLFSTHFHRQDLLPCLEALAAGHLCVGPLLGEVVPASKAPGVYARLRDEPSSVPGVVFDWRTP